MSIYTDQPATGAETISSTQGAIQITQPLTVTGTATQGGTESVTGTTRPSGSGVIGPAALTGAASGTTVNVNNAYNCALYKITIPKEVWTTAATTQDLTIVSLPAKTMVRRVICDTTTAFAGLSGTIQLRVGITAGGQEYIKGHDVKSATVTKGNADADMGANLTIATVAVLGGDVPSWSAATSVSVRLTSGSGNIGAAGVTNLTNGQVTIYIETSQMP